MGGPSRPGGAASTHKAIRVPTIGLWRSQRGITNRRNASAEMALALLRRSSLMAGAFLTRYDALS
jgi:hypothetical protein